MKDSKKKVIARLTPGGKAVAEEIFKLNYKLNTLSKKDFLVLLAMINSTDAEGLDKNQPSPSIIKAVEMVIICHFLNAQAEADLISIESLSAIYERLELPQKYKMVLPEPETQTNDSVVHKENLYCTTQKTKSAINNAKKLRIIARIWTMLEDNAINRSVFDICKRAIMNCKFPSDPPEANSPSQSLIKIGLIGRLKEMLSKELITSGEYKKAIDEYCLLPDRLALQHYHRINQ